jgi:hypothetical protein
MRWWYHVGMSLTSHYITWSINNMLSISISSHKVTKLMHIVHRSHDIGKKIFHIIYWLCSITKNNIQRTQIIRYLHHYKYILFQNRKLKWHSKTNLSYPVVASIIILQSTSQTMHHQFILEIYKKKMRSVKSIRFIK